MKEIAFLQHTPAVSFSLLFSPDKTKDKLQNMCLLLYDLDIIQHLNRMDGLKLRILVLSFP